MRSVSALGPRGTRPLISSHLSRHKAIMSKAELSGCGEDEGVRGKNDSVLVTLASRRAGMAPRARADLLSLGS